MGLTIVVLGFSSAFPLVPYLLFFKVLPVSSAAEHNACRAVGICLQITVGGTERLFLP